MVTTKAEWPTKIKVRRTISLTDFVPVLQENNDESPGHKELRYPKDEVLELTGVKAEDL